VAAGNQPPHGEEWGCGQATTSLMVRNVAAGN
jgi:hypothetical protein